MAEFDPAFNFMLPHECTNLETGDCHCDPDDPGGLTRWGLSQRAFPDLDLRNMTPGQAKATYFRYYWKDQPYGQFASQDVASKVFDLAVNMGQAEAHKLLQLALNDCGEHLVVDGIIGELTIFAVNRCDPELLLESLRYRARDFYLTLVARRPSSSKFLDGWLKRAMA